MADKVIVIGGSGFIGTRLVDSLIANGDDVIIFDKKPSPAHQAITKLGDVRDLDSLRSACEGRSLIYNLAAEHRDDVRPATLYNEVNVGGAETVCKVAEEHNISRIVFASSVAVYGPSQSALSENSPHNYINEYGESKSRAELVYKKWQLKKSRRSLVIVRPTAIFGPGSNGNLNNLILQIKAGRFIMVGTGTNKKSIGYVSNVADFMLYVKSYGPGLYTFNYADKPDFTMNELVRIISQGLGIVRTRGTHLPRWLGFALGSAFDVFSKISGVQLPINRNRVKKFCASTEILSENAFATGFCPKYTMEHALYLTIQEYKCHL